MMRIHPPSQLRGQVFFMGVWVVAALVLLATVPVGGAQNPPPPANGEVVPPRAAVENGAAPTTPNQKAESKEPKFEKARTEAAELSALADQLRNELDKMSFDVFSLDVVDKTEKIEKLAKKIKGDANGFLELNSHRPPATP